MRNGLFHSFFLGGFECSDHRLANGRRLDLLAATHHDRFAASDYRLLQEYGMRTARDGVRWPLIERKPHVYNWASFLPMLRAAREAGMHVIWDLFHYGWPDEMDVFEPEFVDRFAAFTRAFALLLREEGESVPMVVPLNEISYFAWAAGEAGILNPFAKGRGMELKRQLARAAIAAIHELRDVNPATRLIQVDPMIHVVERRDRSEEAFKAEASRLSQFEGWDMIAGRLEPELGGRPEFLDVIGVHYSINNQWEYPGGQGSMIFPSDPRYRHVRWMLAELHERYGRSIFIAETGIEDETRPAWLRYIVNEAAAAISAGVPLEGLCLYPILNHPDWNNGRHCYNGLFDYADDSGGREVYLPLATELAYQEHRMEALISGSEPFVDTWNAADSALDWAAHVMEDRAGKVHH